MTLTETRTYTFQCDICGRQSYQDTPDLPDGWAEIIGKGQKPSSHLCDIDWAFYSSFQELVSKGSRVVEPETTMVSVVPPEL